MSKDTIIRTVILALALINQVLTSMGHSVIPISDEEITTFLTLLFTIGASLIAWWKNNSFSKEAIKADEYLKELKSKEA